jgi:hypothetical protein
LARDFTRERKECGGVGVLEEKGVGGEAGAFLSAVGVGRMFDGALRGDAAEGPREFLEIGGEEGTRGREGDDAEFVDGAVGIEKAPQEIKSAGR